MLTFFAHAGEVHEEAASFFETLPGVILMNLTPFLLLALLVLTMQLFKLSSNWQVGFTLTYFLAVGLLGYNYTPVASIISIIAGFGLSLALVIMPLKKA